MAKPQRISLNARVSPTDYERIVSRAEREGRSLGETIALIIQENQIARVVERTSVACAEGHE